MAASKKKKKRPARSRDERKSVETALEQASRKIEALKTLGADVSSLKTLLDKARASFRKKNNADAKKRVDELLVILRLGAEQMNAVMDPLPGASKRKTGPARKKGNAVPTLDEVEQTVEEAFRKALHSSGLRRMVEVITLEKMRSVFLEQGPRENVFLEALARALRKKKR